MRQTDKDTISKREKKTESLTDLVTETNLELEQRLKVPAGWICACASGSANGFDSSSSRSGWKKRYELEGRGY